METVLIVLAVAGIAAAAWHLVRAAFRFLGWAAAGIWAGEMSQTYARRGDLTALEESRRERVEATRSGVRSGVAAAAWIVVLAAPAFTPWALAIYATYSLLLLWPLARRVA
ncbi:MAG: hypothetical protein R3314_06810 [Longimicrobiales bacterium]|nr:hypothetical protein [Longimicrobiales bacterium]